MKNENNNQQLMKNVMSAVWKVRREYGPGLPESAYKFALVSELRRQGIHAEQKQIHNHSNVVVENSLLLGLRCVDRITRLHSAQLGQTLRNLRFKRGLLLNFNSTFIRQGALPVSI